MPRIALLTPTLITADAISNDIYGMHEVLRQRGYEVRVYANENTTNLDVFPTAKIKHFLLAPEDILIYHYSMGWHIGLKLLQELKCRKVLKYHNITPPEFFVGISADYENVCRSGRQQIKDIARANCDLYLSDSDYNSQELISEGADSSRCFVVAPFHQVDRLEETAPYTPVIDQFATHDLNILMVGRVAPNKGHASLIEALAIYRREFNKYARLFIVGKEAVQLSSYSLSLRQLAADLAMGDAVIFTGAVTDAQLKAYYLASDFFMLTSYHEGFCVPLVEAMALKVPIIACESSAIPGTVGKAGLVWKERNPYLLAESMNYLDENEHISAQLAMMGRKRYEQFFSNERIAEQFVAALTQGGLI